MSRLWSGLGPIKTNCLKVSEGFDYLRKGLKLLEKRFIGPSRRDRDLVSRNRPQGSSQCLSPAPWPAILSGFLLIGGPPFFGKSIFLEVLTSAASIIQEVQLLHWASDINNSWIQVWSLIFKLRVSKTLLKVYLTLILEITLAARSPFVGPTISHSSRLAWLVIFIFISFSILLLVAVGLSPAKRSSSPPSRLPQSPLPGSTRKRVRIRWTCWKLSESTE